MKGLDVSWISETEAFVGCVTLEFLKRQPSLFLSTNTFSLAPELLVSKYRAYIYIYNIGLCVVLTENNTVCVCVCV